MINDKKYNRLPGVAGIVAVAMMALSILTVQSCAEKSNAKDCIVLETETFKLTLGSDAVARSIIIKGNNEEMLLKGAGVHLFSVKQ